MPNGEQSPTLLLCGGKDCAKRERTKHERLRSSALDAGLQVETVGCQGSCAGPTAVVAVGTGYRWFEKLQSAKLQADLIDFARGAMAKPSKRLKSRELTGKRRKKAARRI